ncbi:MAG: PQQ-binding-like beta-propeller repeat protein [Roseibacillus sp.]|nr:PQQ-binding-like beta-propeller repeat protein [Roseibacillus sp.]
MKINYLLTFLALSPASLPAAPTSLEDAVRNSGVKGGLVVQLGAADPAVTASLRLNDRYMVQGLSVDAAAVQMARSSLHSKGLYGPVSVEQFDGTTLPYIENFVNLIVAEDASKVSEKEILRVLVPEGVAWVRRNGAWEKVVKPRPEEIDDWTHYFHNPSGNAVAQDKVVGPPRRMQWVGSPRWSRHHDRMASMSALVSGGGRMFYIMDEGSRVSIQLPSDWQLVARDAFNGTVLWKRPISKWHSQLWPLKSGPSQLARRLVVDGERVFVTRSITGPVEHIDAATGETRGLFKGSEKSEEIIHHEGMLFALIREGKSELEDYTPKHNVGDQARVRTEFVWNAMPRSIRVYDVESGNFLWEKKDKISPLSLSVAGGVLVYHDGENVVCLDRKTGDQRWRSEKAGRRTLIPFNFAPRLVIYEDVVLYAGGDNKMQSYDLASGKRLWESTHDPSGYQSPQDLLVVGGLVWSAPLTSGGHSGVYTGRDPRTGEVKKQFPPNVKTYWFHHRCYIAKATERFLMPSRTGIEFVDFDKEDWDINHWVRGGCLYGVMPANGLTYAPPHNCACYPEAKLYGFNALAPASTTFQLPGKISDEGRLLKGPAFKEPVEEVVAAEGDWPTFRGNAQRSGASGQALVGNLDESWNVELGGRLSALTIVQDQVYVAQIDQHTLHALSSVSGKKRWKFTTGARIDSPPTYWKGRLVFGSADGSVYCLRAQDGALIWKFRAAPVDRRLMAFEQIESVWPVHGTVLVEDGIASFVVGRSTFLDHGLRYIQLDVKTGAKLMERVMDHRDPDTGGDIQDRLQTLQMQVGLPDILSSDGEHTYLRSQKIDKKTGDRLEVGPISGNAASQGGAQKGKGAHLFAPMGFLDDTYFHRAYWVFGKNFAGGHNGYYQAGKFAPAGRMLVFNKDKVYGFGRDPKYLRWTTTIEHQLFGANREAPDAPEPAAGGRRARTSALVAFQPRESMDPTGKPVTVELWVFPDGPGGVVLAHGGPLNGYAVTLKKRVPSFQVRADEKLSVISARKPLKKGWSHLVAVLGEDKSMKLYLNGELAAEGKATGLLSKPPVQGLDLGMDSGSSVGAYKTDYAFTGLLDELRVSFREVGADEIRANHSDPLMARKSNKDAVLACSFDTPSAKDESQGRNNGTLSGVEVGKGRQGKAIWFRKGKRKAGGNQRGGNSYVQRDWDRQVPLFAQGMVLAGDTLLVAGPPDIMDEEYTFERIMEKDKEVDKVLKRQDAALKGAAGGKLLTVSVSSGEQNEELKLDALPVWDGMAVADGSLFVATKDGKVHRFGKK